MSDDKVTYSRSKFSGADAEAITAAIEDGTLPGLPSGAVAAAHRKLSRDLAKLMAANPGKDPFLLFQRQIAPAEPELVCLVMGGFTVGTRECGELVEETP